MKEVKDILYEIYDNYSPVKHSLCLQEDFPKEIKTFLHGYNLINYENFYYENERNDEFISQFLSGCKLDINKTEYKKINKEEIENTSTFPVGTLVIKIYKDIPIIWFKSRFSSGIWYCYVAIKKPNDISDYLKEKNISKKEIRDQTYIQDDKIKDIKDIDVYIPVKAINYDYKTISSLEDETLGEIDKNIEKYLRDEFKIENNIFQQLIYRNKFRFSYSLVIAALNNAHSSLMKSKLAKWLVSKGFYTSFSKYFEPKDNKINLNDTGILTTKQVSQMALNTKKELDKLVQDYTQEKDNKIKKQILKEINKKKKEYSYYLAFTHNSNDNNEISDTVGCYYLLKGLIDLIKKFVTDEETYFAQGEDAASKNNVEYIQYTLKKTQKSLQDIVSPQALNQKSYEFYREVQDSLNSILDQANKLIEELKHSDTNLEYDILKRTVNIIDNFKDKLEAIANMKKTILKEDLEETSPYTNIKSNGIYSLNTGWVKHPVQQDIPDIDMEEFEKEFKVWEDRYFDLIDKIENNNDSLIENLVNEASRRGQTSLKKALIELTKIVLPEVSMDENLTWCVHHIDCDENNNKIENLSIIPLGDHTKLHTSIRNNEIKDVHKVDDYAKDYNIVLVGPALAKIISDSKKYRDGDIIKESLEKSSDRNTLRVDIDNLIEDIYNLRKEGMEEDGEYSIKNLIFKEFRNLGYLDNLKELRKKEISKELSLESLKEELINYSNEDEINYKIKEIMDVISQEFKDPFLVYTTLAYIDGGGMIEGCDYRDLVKLVVPYIIFNDTKYNIYFTDELGWDGKDYIVTRKETALKELYKTFKLNWEEQEETLSKEEFEDHVFTIDKNANYVNVKID